MQTFYMTDAGKVRTHNEDSVIIVSNKNNENKQSLSNKRINGYHKRIYKTY